MNKPSLNDEQLNRLIHQLWSSDPQENGQARVYAVLDGARDRRIEPMVSRSGLNHACLYSGDISYSLRRVAPHIVELEKESAFTRKIFAEGWGESWGIFIITSPSVTLASVQGNCRRIAKVASPEGKTLLFRYYDPRVLRTFLTACEADEIDKIIGPANFIAMEDELAAALLTFSRQVEGSPTVFKVLQTNEGTCTK